MIDTRLPARDSKASSFEASHGTPLMYAPQRIGSGSACATAVGRSVPLRSVATSARRASRVPTRPSQRCGSEARHKDMRHYRLEGASFQEPTVLPRTAVGTEWHETRSAKLGSVELVFCSDQGFAQRRVGLIGGI